MNKKFAICYDFDGTLSPKYMYEYGLLQDLGYNSLAEIWQTVADKAVEDDVNDIALSMYSMLIEAERKNISITKNYLTNSGNNINFFKGINSWFNRINDFGKELGFEIEHYIITSGNEEIVKGCSIADKFKHIFGTKYIYDEDGTALQIGNILSQYDKIGYIHRVSNGIFNHGDYTPPTQPYIPFENMVFIGDGETDLFVMKELSTNGGKSIIVYDKEKPTAKETANNFLTNNQTDFIAIANYEEDSEIENIIKNHLKNSL